MHVLLLCMLLTAVTASALFPRTHVHSDNQTSTSSRRSLRHVLQRGTINVSINTKVTAIVDKQRRQLQSQSSFTSTTKHKHHAPISFKSNHSYWTQTNQKQQENANKIISSHPLAIRNRRDWILNAYSDRDSISTEKMCTILKHSPQPHAKACIAPQCDPSKPMMFSQYAEDYYLYTRHFMHMQTPGIYLDVGANHPVAISNTFFMDRCLGWGGICIEANSAYFEELHRERSCALVPTCVSTRDGENVDFILSGPGSGIVSTHRQGKKSMVQQKQSKVVEQKKCVSIASQLKRYDLTTIDYMNVDIQGGELNALKSINWNSTLIKIISVEISKSSERPIHHFLLSKQYHLINTSIPVNSLPGIHIYPSNRLYIHSSGEFGNPW